MNKKVSGVRCQVSGTQSGHFAFSYNLKPKTYNLRRGFTLVELIVSVGLFAVVMLVSVGALLALTGANRKAQALQSVMNNLNVALDGMVRSIRMGSNYHCGTGSFIGDGTSDDCSTNGDTTFVFEPFGGNPTNPDQWVYSYNSTDKRIYKSVQGGTNPLPLTSPEITIDSMKFYVLGTQPGDTTQPKVVITMKGTAGASNIKTKTIFSIQATAVQRLLDL